MVASFFPSRCIDNLKDPMLSTPHEIFGEEIANDILQSGITLPKMYFGFDLLIDLPGLLEAQSITLVCDANTYHIAGHALTENLQAAGRTVHSLTLPGKPKADITTARDIAHEAQNHNVDLILAVGSGTINDLCKFAAHQLHKPYAVFATAPSMNGYVAANASLVVEGHKTSLAAHLPEAVFCDIEIISAAPKRLIASGLGDTLCRASVQCDWLLSHLLLGTDYNPKPFEWMGAFEPALIENAAMLPIGEPRAVSTLMKALLVGGISMSLCGGSMPASQGEHMIAHLVEMAYGKDLPETFHGEQIAVTSLSMMRRQEALLADTPMFLPPREAEMQELIELVGEAATEEMLGQYHAKQRRMGSADLTEETMEKIWPKISNQAREILKVFPSVEKALQEAGAPHQATHLGWTQEQFMTGVRLARYTRERFTFLDLT